MSMNWCITTSNEIETMSLGHTIGSFLKGGEVIELVSDVGGGKTTLTKGIVAGSGIDGNVSSPTFTVSKVYSNETIEIHHYDFYRLGEIGLMSEELQEVIEDGKMIAIIEWAGSTHDQLPPTRTVRIELKRVSDGEDVRMLLFTIPETMSAWAQKLGLQSC
jgi:tRNA threonylcarbamoyladenosine biosynthesis protein TsaE